MLYTKLNKQYWTGRLILPVLLFVCMTMRSQSMDEVIIKTLKFYKQEVLSYSYDKKWYINNGAVLWLFHADYYSYKAGADVFYRMDYFIEGKTIKYDVVRNQAYHGANMSRQQFHYYKDYRLEPRDVMDGNDPEYIFSQDGNFKDILTNNRYKLELIRQDSCNVLEMRDTVSRTTNLPGAEIKSKIRRYYLSKSDGRVLKAYYSSSGFHGTDSVIFNYVYHKTSVKEVRNKIKDFKPFSKKEEQKPDFAHDSSEFKFSQVQQVPDFALPDTLLRIHNSKDLTSRYILLEFWYKNCGPCLLNMPNLETVRKQFSQADLEVVAINMHDSLSTDLKKKVRTFKATHNWLFNGAELSRQLKIYSYPTTIIYDNSDRRIVFRCIGYSKDYTLRIEKFLKSRISKE